jgi:hypothetical protein
VTGGWKNLCNEFSDIYCVGYIIRLMKSGNLKWPGQVECTGEMRSAHEVSVGKQEGENLLDLDIDGR